MSARDPSEDTTGHRAAKLPAAFVHNGWHYAFIRELGRGGFGVVFLADRTQEGTTQRVAIKVLRPMAGNRGHEGRFQHELQLLAYQPHEAFPKVIDLLTVESDPAVVIEWVSGTSLGDFNEQSLPARVVTEIAAAVAEAMVAAFAYVPPGNSQPLRLVHRDIKPDNLIVSATGSVRLLDLGAATAGESYRAPFTHIAGGRPISPGTAPPEARGEGSGQPEDVYALGATILALRTGGVFFSVPEHRAALQRVPEPNLRAWVERMIAPYPDDRPQMSEVASHLRELAEGLPRPSLVAWVASGMPVGGSLAPAPDVAIGGSETLAPAQAGTPAGAVAPAQAVTPAGAAAPAPAAPWLAIIGGMAVLGVGAFALAAGAWALGHFGTGAREGGFVGGEPSEESTAAATANPAASSGKPRPESSVTNPETPGEIPIDMPETPLKAGSGPATGAVDAPPAEGSGAKLPVPAPEKATQPAPEKAVEPTPVGRTPVDPPPGIDPPIKGDQTPGSATIKTYGRCAAKIDGTAPAPGRVSLPVGQHQIECSFTRAVGTGESTTTQAANFEVVSGASVALACDAIKLVCGPS